MLPGRELAKVASTKVHAAKETVKDIYVQPLVFNFREVLLRGEAAVQNDKTPSVGASDVLSRIHDNVLAFWGQVAPP